MNRIVVNPNRPDTWEIELKEGTSHLGRSDNTDFKIADDSVSSSHCYIIVNGNDVLIQDLGSTNGTFINGAPVQEHKLENGQTIRLGNVEMNFHADAPEMAAPVVADVPPPLVPAFDLAAASTTCKFHQKTYARWFCGKCKRSFCDLCVNSHHVGETVKKTCRTCAVECVPLEIEVTAPTEKGFVASLPGAFIYPFRGAGVLILIFSAILFAAIGAINAGIFTVLMKMAALGYVFSYMQNIIHATANEEAQLPELPGMDDLFSGFFRLAGTVVMSFGLVLGLLVAKFYEVEIPVSVIIITLLLGCLYFPMAFLVVAMKDNVLACNPLVVVPSILRVPGQYAVTVIMFASIFGFQQIGNLVSSAAGSVSLTTRDMSVMFLSFGIRMVWSFASVYLLTVNMRIMGLLYATQKEKLAWY